MEEGYYYWATCGLSGGGRDGRWATVEDAIEDAISLKKLFNPGDTIVIRKHKDLDGVYATLKVDECGELQRVKNE